MPTTDADLLRRAAALMRERAEWASEWNADIVPGDSLHLWVTDYDPSDPTGQTAMQRVVGGADSPWAEHMASWHPPVALAVAKAMDDVAHAWEIANEANEGWVHDPDDDPIRFEDTVDAGWLAVARAYLGDDR